MKTLIVLMDGRELGVMRQDRGRLKFSYIDSWTETPGSYPLSLSMPLASADHAHAAVEPFLWGLLPDNEFILSRWAQRFQVSPRNAFDLIANVGEDCAGAVQFVQPDRRDAFAGAGNVDWLDEANIAQRLRELTIHTDAWRMSYDTGQFSLAGAQPKTALLFDGRRWGVPSGRLPTTHILKPPMGGLDGHAENEHVCLRLAQALGLPTARTDLHYFEDVVAIVIERYDRVRTEPLAQAASAQAALRATEAAMHAASDAPDAIATAARAAAQASAFAADARVMSEFSSRTPIYRVHQEDFCQALRVHPSRKYQSEGGPSPKAIVDLLSTYSSRGGHRAEGDRLEARQEDTWTFLEALAFNWLIGGTDAHAKNYSILLGGNGLVRLAPLYDVSSIFAYGHIDPRKAKLAMRIGRKYLLHHVDFADWEELATEMRVDPVRLIDRIRAMATELPDRLAEELERLRRAKILSPALDRLGITLPERARKLSRP